LQGVQRSLAHVGQEGIMEGMSSILNCLVWAVVLLAPLIALDIAALLWGVDTSGDRGEEYHGHHEG
jgi:hypothetical protein